jgi:hypothetical protein
VQPAPGPRPPKSRPATSGASLNVEPSAALNGANDAGDLIAVIDEHLATAEGHPAGTTDRLLEADR